MLLFSTLLKASKIYKLVQIEKLMERNAFFLLNAYNICKSTLYCTTRLIAWCMHAKGVHLCKKKLK